MAVSLYIVITDFNGYAQTRRCLSALALSEYQDFEVVVVDHGTTAETGAAIAADFQRVKVVKAGSDLWWSGATNVGVRCALECGAELVMLINNDCYVAPDTVGVLVEQWRRRPDSIVAPIQRDWYSKEITMITPRTLLLLGFPTVVGRRRLTPSMRAKHLISAHLIGGGRGVLIPATVFGAVGLFDEKSLPHYWADHDFYLRVRQAGVALNVCPLSFVDIDSERTTLADQPGRMTLAEFMASLTSIRSHRNVYHVMELFRRHYPIKPLYMLGVALYTGRYIAMYFIKRLLFLGGVFMRGSREGRCR